MRPKNPSSPRVEKDLQGLKKNGRQNILKQHIASDKDSIYLLVRTFNKHFISKSAKQIWTYPNWSTHFSAIKNNIEIHAFRINQMSKKTDNIHHVSIWLGLFYATCTYYILIVCLVWIIEFWFHHLYDYISLLFFRVENHHTY